MMVRIVVILGLMFWPLAVADAYGTGPQGGQHRRAEPTESSEETKTFKVSGKVVNLDGEPQEHAKVSFDGPKSGEAWTGKDGAFSFEGPAGDYKVKVKIGSKSQLFAVTITESGLQPSGELVFRN